ncbi:MAG TPA: hypothetical protein VF190_11130 [Rhodothermales bacterium]
MFLGHFAAGLGGKAVAPRTSLGTLFFAAQFVDLLWPTLLLLGLEEVAIRPGVTAFNPLDFVSYPYSHSLLMAFVWSGVFAGVYWLVRKNGRGATVAGLLVFSHWVLDLVVHRPDLPLAFGESTRVGFGLWHSVPATIAIELLLIVAGTVLYLRTTRARDRVGRLAFWGLIAFLLLIFLSSFGAPPPNASAIAWVGQAQWLLVLWGYWVDRHRRDGNDRSTFGAR